MLTECQVLGRRYHHCSKSNILQFRISYQDSLFRITYHHCALALCGVTIYCIFRISTYIYFSEFLHIPITATGRSLSEVPQQEKKYIFSSKKILTYHHHWALALSEVPQQVDQKQRLCLDRNSQKSVPSTCTM